MNITAFLCISAHFFQRTPYKKARAFRARALKGGRAFGAQVGSVRAGQSSSVLAIACLFLFKEVQRFKAETSFLSFSKSVSCVLLQDFCLYPPPLVLNNTDD